MNHTGVFLTKEETEEMQLLLESAQKTPVILVGGVDLAGSAYTRMFKRLTELAKSHGLPDIPGEYGLTQEGELVTV